MRGQGTRLFTELKFPHPVMKYGILIGLCSVLVTATLLTHSIAMHSFLPSFTTG